MSVAGYGDGIWPRSLKKSHREVHLRLQAVMEMCKHLVLGSLGMPGKGVEGIFLETFDGEVEKLDLNRPWPDPAGLFLKYEQYTTHTMYICSNSLWTYTSGHFGPIG